MQCRTSRSPHPGGHNVRSDSHPVQPRPLVPAALLTLALLSGCRGAGGPVAESRATPVILPATAERAGAADCRPASPAPDLSEPVVAADEVRPSAEADGTPGRSRWSKLWPFERADRPAAPAARPSVELPRVTADAGADQSVF